MDVGEVGIVMFMGVSIVLRQTPWQGLDFPAGWQAGLVLLAPALTKEGSSKKVQSNSYINVVNSPSGTKD